MRAALLYGSRFRVQGFGVWVSGLPGKHRSQGYIRKRPPPYDPRHMPFVGSYRGVVSHGRGTPVVCGGSTGGGGGDVAENREGRARCSLISQNSSINKFQKVNSPTKSSTYCLLLLIKILSRQFCGGG